ncbi:hypothetical protein MGAST_18570 [Mycobacterium gastri 'Wayne']|nr:hypothetical protein MGAST_18570 [Mycobacterium gastri 'Wayne']
MREGIEAIVFRTVGDQVSVWEAVLPPELLKLPDELARVDGLLDDPVFFAPFVGFFDPRIGRPSTPMETYLWLMFLKFRYRLGYESLCRSAIRSPGGGFAGPTSPVITPMRRSATHQPMRATASLWALWRCSMPGARSRPNGMREKP